MVKLIWTDSMVITLMRLAIQSGTHLVSGKGVTVAWNNLIIDLLTDDEYSRLTADHFIKGICNFHLNCHC